MARGGMVGADPDQLDLLARTFTKGGEQLRAAEKAIGALVRTTAWRGTKAEAFRGEWGSGPGAGIAKAAGALLDMATLLGHQAQQQRHASNPGSPGIPNPPPDPPVDPGAGRWGSQPIYSRADDLAFEEVVKGAATGADGLGYTNAARHLRHYLDNSGEDVGVDPARIARDNPNFKGTVEQQLSREATEAARRALASGQTGIPVEFSSDWAGTYLTEKDWFYAMGGVQHAVTGYVVVSPTDPSQVEVHYRTHVFDRYNWDGGKEVEIGPILIKDEQMGALHTAGLAKEYDLRGSTGEQVQTVRLGQDGNIDLGELPVAGDRDGERTDPGRDQQLGDARVGAAGLPR